MTKIYFNGKLLREKIPRKKNGQFERYDRVFMKRFVIGFFVIIPWTLAIAQYQALAQPVTYEKAPQEAQNELLTNETPKLEAKEQYKQYAREKAIENGVSVRWIMYAIDVESAYTWNPEIQSNVKYNFSDQNRGIIKGEQEISFGLSQIHLPDNPNISKEKATDPYYAIDFLIEETKNGNYDWRWKNTYKKYRIKYPI